MHKFEISRCKVTASILVQSCLVNSEGQTALTSTQYSPSSDSELMLFCIGMAFVMEIEADGWTQVSIMCKSEVSLR